MILVDIQPLLNGEYEAIYRGRRGEKVVDLYSALHHYETVEI